VTDISYSISEWGNGSKRLAFGGHTSVWWCQK